MIARSFDCCAVGGLSEEVEGALRVGEQAEGGGAAVTQR